jgi:leucyl aminopeptidase
MQFFVSTSSPARQRTECAIVGVFDKGTLTAAANELDQRFAHRLSRLAKSGDVRGKLGETLLLADLQGGPAQRVLLVGLGSQKDYGRKQYRRAMQAAINAVIKLPVREAVSYLCLENYKESSPYYFGRTAAEIVGNALYRIPDHKTARKPPTPALKSFGIALEGRSERAQGERGLEHGQAIVAGASLTRDLGNQPANVCTPTYLANTARNLAREYKSLRVQILGEAEAKRLKMGSFLSVTNGSEEPAKLIVIEYRGGERGDAPVVLVGKGVTFDTGGISLKPPAAMDEMKWDMSGAGSVLGTFKAVAELELPINLVGVIPACENMPSGRATKPGDIVHTMSGQTVEILNTDAEGRLILCDAITYARRFKPDVLIDIATLTGACVMALGSHYCGLFSNDEELAAALKEAGERADDRAWRLPMGEEYAEGLKSNFADMANVAGREGGAITAACFLGKFTDGLKWAHLDIAGTAWLGGAQKGSTGRPVPLLMDYLINRVS